MQRFQVTCVLLLSILLHGAAVMRIRDYNTIDYAEYGSYEELRGELLDPVTSKFTKNVFLGLAKEECWETLESPTFRASARYAPHAVISRSLPARFFPWALMDCAEIFFYRIGDRLDQWKGSTTDLNTVHLSKWMSTQTAVQLTLVNDFVLPLRLYWHEEGIEPVEQGVIQPGGFFSVDSYLGHIFSASAASLEHLPTDLLPTELVSVSDSPASHLVLDYFAVVVPEQPLSAFNRIESCEFAEHSTDHSMPLWLTTEEPIKCLDMSSRLAEYTHRVWHEHRLAMNYLQPQLLLPLTAQGYSHQELPSSTFQWLLEHYATADARTEKALGATMNQVIAPSVMIELYPAQRTRLVAEVQPILEEWAGIPLEYSALYGIRKYTLGSILRMHVDTASTHVISAIINVSQNTENDWPLVLVDHEDREQFFYLNPGDILLYEGAKLLHGRPQPLEGEHYANIFVHFKPVSGWDAFLL